MQNCVLLDNSVFFINRNILDSIKDFTPYLSNVSFIDSFLFILHFILVIDTIYPPNAREPKRTKTAFITASDMLSPTSKEYCDLYQLYLRLIYI